MVSHYAMIVLLGRENLSWFYLTAVLLLFLRVRLMRRADAGAPGSAIQFLISRVDLAILYYCNNFSFKITK